jgi:lipopolysaccharide export system protein LptA
MPSYFHLRLVLLPVSFGLLSAAFVLFPRPIAAAQDREQAEAARNSPPEETVEALPKTSPAPKGGNGAVVAGQSLAPSGKAAVTTITAQKRLLLDSQGREATFWGDVKVVDSRFSMACEKLTVFFRDNTGGAKALEGKDAKEGKGGKESGEGHGVGALEKAVAEGDVIIFQEKTNDKGEVERSVGRSQKAVYDTKTGNIALSGWPQVEQKQNTIVAMEEGTVILLNQKGTLEVLGHSKSVLRSTSSENGR